MYFIIRHIDNIYYFVEYVQISNLRTLCHLQIYICIYNYLCIFKSNCKQLFIQEIKNIHRKIYNIFIQTDVDVYNYYLQQIRFFKDLKMRIQQVDNYIRCIVRFE